MANLKSGTLIGGNLIWNAGNLPLKITDKILYFNDTELYSSGNKPTNDDLNMVSRAGDTMTNNLNFNTASRGISVSFPTSSGVSSNSTGVFGGNGDGAASDKTNMVLKSWYGIGIQSSLPSSAGDGNTVWIDARTGKVSSKSDFYAQTDKKVYHQGFKPTAADVGAVSKAGDTMVGTLTVPTFVATGGSNLKTITVDGNINLSGGRRINGASNSTILRDHGNGNVTLSGSLNTTGTAGDLYLGYNASGHATRYVRVESRMDWKASHTLVSVDGELNSEKMYGDRARVYGYRVGDKSSSAQDQIDTIIGQQTAGSPGGGGVYLCAGESALKVLAFHPLNALETVITAGDGAEGAIFYTGCQSATGAMTEPNVGKATVHDGRFRAYGLRSHSTDWSKFMEVGVGTLDTFLYNSVSKKYLQMRDNGEFCYDSKKVYYEGFKPTAADVGAVSKAGDTMTGVLCVANNTQFGNGANGSFGSTTVRNQITDSIEIVTPTNASQTSSTGIVFHNRGASTSGLFFKNTNSTTGYFNFVSDETNWDVRVNNNKVFHEDYSFGLGGKEGTAPEATTVTGGVTDFNLLKTTGWYTLTGNWKNNVNNKGDVAESLTATCQIIARRFSAGPAITQIVYGYSVGSDVTGKLASRQWYRVGNGSPTVWGKWKESGNYSQNLEYRLIIDRPGATLYPYATMRKAELRTDATGDYTVGVLQFKAGDATDLNNPDTAKQVGALNVAMNKENTYGRISLSARNFAENNTVADLMVYEGGTRVRNGGKSIWLKRGKIVLDGNGANTEYDIESLSSASNGSKKMLRKFRGGGGDVIWHETVQGSIYKISTGVADSTPVIELTHNGVLRAANEVKSASSNSYRIIPPGSGAIGSFWRNDNTNTYLLFTNAGDAESGGYNTLRPVRFNNATGQAHFDNGAFSTNGFHLPHSCSITWNSSAAWAGGVGWGMQEDSSTGHLIIHRYENGVWKNAPFKFQNDLTFVCDGNGNFNDVYIRSDKRLKSSITPIEDNLSKVLQLNPVKYDKKKTLESEETEEELGLIAQEVEKIIPLAVATSDDETKLKALKPYALIATLIGAVKELKAELDELKSQI